MAVNRERKLVFTQATSFNINQNTLSEAIETLQHLQQSYGREARIERRSYEYGDGEYLAVMVEQPETDQQMARRIAQEVRDEALREERDRWEFERLAQKFGKV